MGGVCAGYWTVLAAVTHPTLGSRVSGNLLFPARVNEPAYPFVDGAETPRTRMGFLARCPVSGLPTILNLIRWPPGAAEQFLLGTKSLLAAERRS